MSEELAEVDFQRFWRRLQQLGLNAYESRSYLVLLGHPKFKALELAARAHVPRQKIYEVLDSLVEKGFAQVVQEKTKLFSAVEPSLAIPGYLGRKRQILEQELTDNGRAGSGLIDDLKAPLFGRAGRPRHPGFPADCDRTGTNGRRVSPHACGSAAPNTWNFPARPTPWIRWTRSWSSRPARAAWPAGCCWRPPRWMTSTASASANTWRPGVEVRIADSLPMKLAVFDGQHGMIALLDPVITRPTWTAVVFHHEGMGEAMKGLFEDHWRRGRSLD